MDVSPSPTLATPFLPSDMDDKNTARVSARWPTSPSHIAKPFRVAVWNVAFDWILLCCSAILLSFRSDRQLLRSDSYGQIQGPPGHFGERRQVCMTRTTASLFSANLTFRAPRSSPSCSRQWLDELLTPSSSGDSSEGSVSASLTHSRQALRSQTRSRLSSSSGL